MLDVRDLTVTYGGVKAVDHVTFQAATSTVHGLIGPNGAGKSSALNAISAIVTPTAGEVTLDGVTLTGLGPAAILRKGLARTFQQAQLWAGMSVLQNLTVPMLRLSGERARARATQVADTMGISNLLELSASELPFGQRRLVEVARAMTTEPKALLLDEPGAGLTLQEKDHLVDVLRRLAEAGTTVVLVDHDMEIVMRACDVITVLDTGRVLTEGTPDEVTANEQVLSVYLGGSVA